MPVSLPFLPSLLSIFSPPSPPFSPILNPVPLLLPDRLGKRKIHCVLHPLHSLSLSLSLYTHAPPTLSLPLTYLISLEHEIRNVVFSFFFFTGEKGSGRLRSSRRENSTRGGGSLRGTLYYYPPPSPDVFSLKPSMRRTPFPFPSFSFFFKS